MNRPPPHPHASPASGAPVAAPVPAANPAARPGEDTTSPGPRRPPDNRRPKTRPSANATAPTGDTGAANSPPPPPRSEQTPTSGKRLAPEARRAIAIAGAVVIAAAVVVGLYFRSIAPPAPPDAPRVDDPIERIARYVAAEEFASLPFERQRHYMEMLDDRRPELAPAYAAGRLGADDYRRALEYAWFGEQLPRMEKYLALPEAEREAYLDKRLDKKGKGSKKKDGGGPSHGDAVGGGAGGGGTAASPSGIEDGGRPEVHRDEQSEKDIPKTWPPEWRSKWKEYRDALKDRREEREETAGRIDSDVAD